MASSGRTSSGSSPRAGISTPTTTAQTNLTNITFRPGQRAAALEGKLTISFTPNHNVIASYLEIDSGQHQRPVQSATSTSTVSRTDRRIPRTSLAFNYTGILTPTFFLEAQYSERNYQIAKGSGGQVQDPHRRHPDALAGTSYRYYTPTFCGVCENEEREQREHPRQGLVLLHHRGHGDP